MIPLLMGKVLLATTVGATVINDLSNTVTVLYFVIDNWGAYRTCQCLCILRALITLDPACTL